MKTKRLIELGFDTSTAKRVGCSRCQVMVIMGVPTHEQGCPNQTYQCKGCNNLVSRGMRYCEDCR
jgi:hypothetical protein